MHNICGTESEDTFYLLHRCLKVSKLFGHYRFKGKRFYQDPADPTLNATTLTEDKHLHKGKKKPEEDSCTQQVKHWTTQRKRQLPIQTTGIK